MVWLYQFDPIDLKASTERMPFTQVTASFAFVPTFRVGMDAQRRRYSQWQHDLSCAHQYQHGMVLACHRPLVAAVSPGCGLQKIMMNDPAILHAMLANLTTALTRYVCYQIDSGAHVVQLFDSWSHHLSPAQFREFSLPYAQRVIDEVRKVHPTVPLIFHANGSVGKLAAMQSCTADVLGVDWNTDMQEAREAFPARVTQGNVDPMVLFGPEELICEAVKSCLSAAGPQHHILNVGHGVVQGTPEENVELFVRLAREGSLVPGLTYA
jgi:hypothetical protein